MLKLTVIIIIILFSGCIIVPTYIDRISLNTTNRNEQEVHMGNVLLIGTGPVASRVFLDNLSTEMIESFKQRSIQSEFSYIGNMPQSSTLSLDSFANAKFDTYFVFQASDHSYLNMTKPKYTGFGPGIIATGFGNQYSETYTVMLYNKKENIQMIWKGDLNVDFDLANNNKYKRISKLIFDELVKNHILHN